LLSRSEITGTTAGGDFTIGTVVPGYDDVLKSPTYEVISDTYWVTAINGVVVNGTSFSGNSQYLEGNQISALLDTGTSQATATKAYVDALYSNIPGAEWSATESTYLFPCESVVDFSVVFGQQTIFIHPIDLAAPYEVTSDGSAICSGTFQVNDGSGVDLLLGDSFLRNVYSLFFFGEWTNSGEGIPYMQVLGVTDRDQAFSEFPSLNAQRIQDFIKQNSNSNSNSNSHSTDSETVNGAASSGTSSTVDLSGLNRNSYIIMGMVGVAIALLLANLAIASRKNQGYKQIGTSGSAPPPHFVDRSYSTPYDDHDR